MTNRERLAKMNDEELAEALCDMTENCEECIGTNLCKYGDGHGNGLLKWLKDEVEDESMSNYARWKDVFHYGFGYTVCPYCGDETPWYNAVSTRFQSDLTNNQREYCPKCGKRVYAREGWLMNQPPEVGKDNG